MATLQEVAQAISNAEGYGIAGAIPTTHNNPGDLTSGGQIIQFPSLSAGQAALQKQIAAMANGSSSIYSPDMTIAQVGQLYANGDSNWANNVASSLGVPTSATIGSVVNGTPSTAQATPAPSTDTSTSSGPLGAVSSWIGANLEGGVFIVLGLLLIAAGIFSFKQTGDVIKVVGKTAVEAAA